MTENKHRVCFLYKKPVRDSVLGKFITQDFSWDLVILLAIADIS